MFVGKARRLERLTGDKHSSLLRKSINYRPKSFISLDPGHIDVIKPFFLSTDAAVRKLGVLSAEFFSSIV